jgi:sulfur carrier protein ThiS
MALKKKEMFDKIGDVIEAIEFDTNDGNRMTIKKIIAILGLTEANIAFYVEKSFFPANWKYLDEKIWSCYL